MTTSRSPDSSAPSPALPVGSGFEAIFWDNDGILVDTEGLYYRATRQVLAGLGVDLSEDDYRELFLRQSRGAWHLVGDLSREQIAAYRKQRDDVYAGLLLAGAPFLPGVREAARRLARRFRMAIVTSSDHFHHIHRDAEFLRLFEFVLTPADYQHSKPHPEPYLRAVERIGLDPARCLVIEDSERGLRAAKSAGLTCWIVPSTLTRGCAFDGADRVLENVTEVEAALLPG